MLSDRVFLSLSSDIHHYRVVVQLRRSGILVWDVNQLDSLVFKSDRRSINEPNVERAAPVVLERFRQVVQKLRSPILKAAFQLTDARQTADVIMTALAQAFRDI